MDVKELVRKNKTLVEYKEKCINAYTELLNIGEELHKLEENDWIKLREKGVNDAINFFEESGFTTLSNDNKYVFTLFNTIIKYFYDGEDEMIMFPIEIQPNQIFDTVQIRHSSEYDSMLSWKYNIALNGNQLYKENYEDTFNNCDDLNELQKSYSKLNENIENYKNTIKNISNVKYIYSLYKQDIECDTFKELFENHIIG
ncbi:hypothetical protein [Terrisporobacter mayombei]|uniref:Uncharacterized protein n=1 Tax=Terrisporobacter mayombei TaxID=1541 RepID=A0ABY9PW86_9FIRM|nr:hypothetical protein [Terrisporobacter mayombei]WMT79927.1 hypothetical protein TEMA_01980 [Terrisporobacter mayombei]